MNAITRIVPAVLLSALAGQAFGQCSTLAKVAGPSPAASDQFGAVLAMGFGGPSSTPLLAVGTPNEDPAASGANAGGFAVYQKTAGAWSLLANVPNAGGSANERLGAAIGLTDSYLIAGAPGFNNGAGRARIYHRLGSGYFFTTDLGDATLGLSDNFGAAAAISTQGGDWAVVGAPNHDFHGLVNSGAAFFYARVNGAWIKIGQLWGADLGGDHNDLRGSAVAMSQTSPYAVVGSPNYEFAGNPADHGAVTVATHLSAASVGTFTTIAPPAPEAGEHFGAAVAIEGDYLVVGAPDEDITFAESGFQYQRTDSGAVYVFQHVGFNWNFVAKLRSPSPQSSGRFGATVSTDGQQIIVGEPGAKRACVFTRSGAEWKLQGALADPDAAATGGFGAGVALRAGEIVVGDNLDDAPGAVDAGAFYCTFVNPLLQIGDECSNPLPMPSGTIVGCTTFATPSLGQPVNCDFQYYPTDPDVWYLFQPTCDGNAIVDTLGSAYDTILSVHTGCPSPFESNLVTCNDDYLGFGAGSRASLVAFEFTGGQSYYIRVSGFNGAAGAFTLRPTFSYPAPSNDFCSGALPIGVGVTPFSTCMATEESIPSCGGLVYKDIWFRYTAQQAGRVDIDTCGTGYRTILQAFDGDYPCGQALHHELACNVDPDRLQCNGAAKISCQLPAGKSLLFRVGGYLFDDNGPGVLTVNFVPQTCGAVDFNADGVLDPDDLSDYIGCFFSTPSCPQADWNHDTFTDPDDLSDYIAAYFAGCP